MNVVKRNAIRCLKCGDIIESKSLHDFQVCSCGACYVDGGQEYIRVGGNPEDWHTLTEYEVVPGAVVTVYYHYGRHNTFTVPMSQVQEVIKNYEDMWHFVIVTDEDGNEIYRTEGVEKYEDKHNN